PSNNSLSNNNTLPSNNTSQQNNSLLNQPTGVNSQPSSSIISEEALNTGVTSPMPNNDQPIGTINPNSPSPPPDGTIGGITLPPHSTAIIGTILAVIVAALVVLFIVKKTTFGKMKVDGLQKNQLNTNGNVANNNELEE
ncbi:9890_t:CDS:1, partial [Racocetra persica]